MDEIPESQLIAELERRKKLRADGKCDYCERYGDTPTCRFHDRHAVAQEYQQSQVCSDELLKTGVAYVGGFTSVTIPKLYW